MAKSLRFVGMALVAAALATTASAQNIAIVGGRADDPFVKVKRGIDDAAMIVEAHGGRVTYLPLQTYDNIGADAANLIRTAVGQGADAIAAPNWVPSAEDAAYQAATAAGKIILLYNAGGTEKAKELGALNYVGTEDYTTGPPVSISASTARRTSPASTPSPARRTSRTAAAALPMAS